MHFPPVAAFDNVLQEVIGQGSVMVLLVAYMYVYFGDGRDLRGMDKGKF